MSLKLAKRFPSSNLARLLNEWPWLNLRFRLPLGRLSDHPGFAADWLEVSAEVSRIVRTIFEVEERCLGFVIVPDYGSAKGLSNWCVAVYLSCFYFRRDDMPRLEHWGGLAPADQVKRLAIFYRHPNLTVNADDRRQLQGLWRLSVRRMKMEIADDMELVSYSEKPAPLKECLAAYIAAVSKERPQQLKRIRLSARGNGIRVKCAGGTSETASDFIGVSRILDRWLSPRGPRQFGFFANRERAFSWVVATTLRKGLDPHELRAQGIRAFKQLARLSR